MCFVSLVAIIKDINFTAILPNVIPLHLFKLDKTQVFGEYIDLILSMFLGYTASHTSILELS